MKVLVIGSGPVGLAALLGLKCKNDNVEIFLSEEQENRTVYQELFGLPTISSFSGRGGLGRFWHNVLDLSYAQEKYTPSAIHRVLEYFWSVSLLDCEKYTKNLSSNIGLEIVPTKLFRPQKRIELFENLILKPAVDKLIPRAGDTRVIFKDNTSQDFERVIVCAGAFGTALLLTQSGLAKSEKEIGDHIIFVSDVGGHYENPDLKITTRGRNYISRCYLKEGLSKIMLRPSFAKKQKKSLIYNKSSLRTIYEIVMKMDLGTILESTNLRYGYPSTGKSFKTVSQISVSDAYLMSDNGTLTVNKKSINKQINLLEKSGKFDSYQIFSGIHYFKTAALNSLEILSMPSEETKIAVFSPALEERMPSNHFTFSIMLAAFEYAKNIKT